MSDVRRWVRYLNSQSRLGQGLVVDLDEQGHVTDKTRVQPVVGDIFGETKPVGEPIALADVSLLVPIMPSKVVAVASNYRKHADEMGNEVPAEPRLFVVPNSAVVGSGEAIELPPCSDRVDHEAELAVVIGRTMNNVSETDALAHVFGYCCANDVTARDHQKKDRVFGRAKGFDTFCPLGPWITTGVNPSDLRVRAWVDGTERQDGRTSEMVVGVPGLLSFISRVMTLWPGDVVLTGTPAGVGPLQAGQTVTVEIEGLGRLNNPVRLRAED